MSGHEGERVSRRNLLRTMIGRLGQAVGVEMAPSPSPAPMLAVPYVPYTVRPSEAGERRSEEETR